MAEKERDSGLGGGLTDARRDKKKKSRIIIHTVDNDEMNVFNYLTLFQITDLVFDHSNCLAYWVVGLRRGLFF